MQKKVGKSQIVITYNGKESEKEYIYININIYNCITLLYTWNIVNQLYLNKKLKLKKFFKMSAKNKYESKNKCFSNQN